MDIIDDSIKEVINTELNIEVEQQKPDLTLDSKQNIEINEKIIPLITHICAKYNCSVPELQILLANSQTGGGSKNRE
jgi:hypothetical protein